MLRPTKPHYSERSEKAPGEYLILSFIKTPWHRLKHMQSVIKLKLNTFSLQHHGVSVRPDQILPAKVTFPAVHSW